MDYSDKVKEIQSAIDFSSVKYRADIDTNYGLISLDFLPEKAPNHCKNFIALAKSGFYNGLCFHRIIKGFMIQGGCPEGTGTGGPGYQINQEFNNTPHEAGVLSMARSQDPNSAGSQFFICLDKSSWLDGEYTAFGRATAATMPVVSKIGEVTTKGQDVPVEKVIISSVTVVEATP